MQQIIDDTLEQEFIDDTTRQKSNYVFKIAVKNVFFNIYFYVVLIIGLGIIAGGRLPASCYFSFYKFGVNPLWILSIIWFAICTIIFTIITVLRFKKNLSTQNYINDNSKISPKEFLNALASVLLNKFNYIIWLVSAIPVYDLADSLFYTDYYKNTAKVIAMILWFVLIFTLLASRKAKKLKHKER